MNVSFPIIFYLKILKKNNYSCSPSERQKIRVVNDIVAVPVIKELAAF